MSMIIVSSVFVNIYMWELQLINEDNNRLNEKIEIQKLGFGPGLPAKSFYIELKNTGTIDINIVALWVNDTRYTVTEAQVSEGELKRIEILLTPYQWNIDPIYSTFPVSVFTERGTSESETYLLLKSSDYGDVTWDVAETGVFRLDWTHYKYTSKNHLTPIDATVILKSETYVAFYLRVVNNWCYPVIFLNQSFLTLTSISLKDKTIANFFIVDAIDYTSNATFPKIKAFSNTDYMKWIIWPGETQILVFAANTISSTQWKWDPGNFYNSGLEGTGVQISIYYNAVGYTFGQTIKAQALVIV